MSESDELASIQRRQGRSGIGYADPVVLHDTRDRRVELVPFFIPRSDHTEIAVKLLTYSKRPPPHEWVLDEERSMSLDESAARKLLEALKQHLQVTSELDGDYLLVPVSNSTGNGKNIESAALRKALSTLLQQREVTDYLSSAEVDDELFGAFRTAIRLNEMKSAVAQLREYLESGEVREEIFQKWCETHSWAFGNAYVLRDQVREISPGDNLDLLLPNALSGYRDLVELKRPDAPVLNYDRSHKNYYFSAEAAKAIGQVHRYLDVLHEVAGHGLRDHTEIIAYHPRAVIVIGRSKTWNHDQSKALHGLNSRLSGVSLMTYDHLLILGERMLEMISMNQPTATAGDAQ